MQHLKNNNKSDQIKKLLEQTIEIMVEVGIPIENQTERRIERMAMALLAVAGVTSKWSEAKGIKETRFLKTREIIEFINEHFEEKISSGSYDDIRRKDLKYFVVSGLILNNAEKPNAATNDPTRGYTLEQNFKELVVYYLTKEWNKKLANFIKGRKSLKELLDRKRNIQKMKVKLPNKKRIELSSGEHNVLQKQIIEEFLPRYGKGCQVLYIGDTAKKILHIDNEKLNELNFVDLSHDKLPDIIAYNNDKNWLYLIEAVYSSGSISEIRMLELKKLTKNGKADIIYVTAFLNKTDFRKWITEIAWETEVWIAENPDHLIHFDGDKFLGPYKG